MKKLGIILAIAVGVGLIVGLGVGQAAKQSIRSDTEAIEQETEEIKANTPVVDPAQDELATWWLANEDKWYEMSDRFSAVDLEGAVDVMNSMDPIPNASLNNLFIRYQAEINEALIRLNAGDIVGATSNIKAGTAIMRDITAEIDALG